MSQDGKTASLGRENESEEASASPPVSGKDTYAEEPGEFDDDNDEFWRKSGTKSFRQVSASGRLSYSSGRTRSKGSSDFDKASTRRSLNRTTLDGNYSTYGDEPPLFFDHDLADLLPDDIHTQLVEYWQDIDDRYYPINDKAFTGITNAHKKVTEYPNTFISQFLNDLDAPDNRMRIANRFRSDFNKVPRKVREDQRVKSTLHTRTNELVLKLEGITEQKLHNAKQKAYQLLSETPLTSVSSKIAKLFGVLLHTEADRFAESVKFINEHYYKTIALDLRMPHKVRWKEVLELGLVSKKFVCEQIRMRCLEWPIDNESGTWPVGDDSSVNTDSDEDLCGGGPREKVLTNICEDDDDESTPPEEISLHDSNSLLNLEELPGEDGYPSWYGNGSMSGEMKLSLKFDSTEYLGEVEWPTDVRSSEGSYNMEAARRSAQESLENETYLNETVAVAAESEMTNGSEGKGSIKSDRSKSKKSIERPSSDKTKRKSKSSVEGGDGKEEEAQVGKKKKKKDPKRKSKSKKPNKQKKEETTQEEESQPVFSFEEEDDEELEMEAEVTPIVPPSFEDDEYPGEFWEGEGYNLYGSLQDKEKKLSVRIEPKGKYIREFFWDSEPSSRQDLTKKKSEGLELCDDVLDDEEFYDYEDIFYDRPEFFEGEVDTCNKNEVGQKEFHPRLFGSKNTSELQKMSLVDKLLSKWTKKQTTERDKNIYDIDQNVGFLRGSGDAGLDPNPNRKSEGGETGETDLTGITPTTPNYRFSNDDDTKSAKRHSELPWTIFDKHYDGMLQLHPSPYSRDNLTVEVVEETPDNSVGSSKRPLLECYIHLQEEIWHAFEVAFRAARSNVEKVLSSLRTIASRAYPRKDPRDPCDSEETLEDIVAKGEAIRDKYRRIKQAIEAKKPQKVIKHVHMFGSHDGDEFDGEGYYSSEEEEDESDGVSGKHSVEASLENAEQEEGGAVSAKALIEASAHAESIKPASMKAKSMKSVNKTEENTDQKLSKKEKETRSESSGKKEQGSGEGPNNSPLEATEEESDQKGSFEEAENIESEKALSKNDGHNSEMSRPSELNSILLERVVSETNLKTSEFTDAEPTDEERQLMRKARRAMLILKLNNWEKTLELEADRLTRQLDLIESHAQHEFQLLKHIPYHIWERSKGDAAAVYHDDLKKDIEVGEVFRCAIEYGSPLYGDIYLDRYDLMMQLKPSSDVVIALKTSELSLGSQTQPTSDMFGDKKSLANSVASCELILEEENEE